MKSLIATYAADRPDRNEHDRAQIAESYNRHLSASPVYHCSDEDIDAMKAAFIRRFDEDLPRTETLMAVANIGYRMALRDMNKDA